MIARPRKTSPAIVYLCAVSMTYARSPAWKRSRCVALGAIRHTVETAVDSSVA